MTVEQLEVLSDKLGVIEKEDILLYIRYQGNFLKLIHQEVPEDFGSPSTIYEFQQNHVKYMISAFSLNNPRLMLKLIIWLNRVYLHKGIAEPGFLWIYSKSQEIAAAFLPKKGSASITRFYQFIIEYHHELMQIAKSDISLDLPVMQPLKKLQQTLLDSLLSGNVVSAKSLADHFVNSRESYIDFCIHVIQPVMYQVGFLWETGKINVAHEHLATAMISRILAQLYGPFVFGEGSKGKIVIATLFNEKHEIGARIVADFLEIDGWEVHFLGGNIPQEDHLAIILEKNPDLVGISVTMPYNIEFAQQLISTIRKESRKKCGILLGGPLLNDFKASFERFNMYYCRNASEALKYANQFISERM